MAVLVGLALLRSGAGHEGQRHRWAYVVGFVVVCLAVPALLAATGQLDQYDPMPAPALLLVLLLTVPAIQ
jgi:hypothetical protein